MTKHLIDELSVFFPCYNEEKNIEMTIDRAIPVLNEVAKKWEILLINDGSKDDTARVLKLIKAKYKSAEIRIITHPQNRGYGAALKSGFYNASYKWIVFTDADGQFDFGEISKFIQTQEKTAADLVIGYYLGRKVSSYRIWGSYVWQLAVYLLFGLRVKDIDCGFKLIKKEVIDTIPQLESERGPFISSEFLIKAKKSGFKIVEIGATHFPRQHGEATGTKLNVVLAGLKDLVGLWFKINFSRA